MKNSLLNDSDPQVAELFKQLERIKGTFERLEKDNRQTFGKERFLNDRELSGKLKLSRRALQDYRAAGIFPYYLISGKVLYKESEIEQVLQSARKSTPDIDDLV
ncbi:MAG: excisionase [Bacteroidetes bacterium GWF2_42_66]|nr:MAG: excisionase [Bacteroidetes bacterium GWA2_42_15]OFX98217.1 MAG: excisionase [Bacteroidetes bacterium GWE2_42_39]OFY42600.1 MAG: excisionase [Bacteroidetes bacterium GWF2_42_66]HAZ03029.1 DNA-binding protein [Marinilabiliales bacterium]HBL74320.1 DNA-binding protein [Prolixibacteraceae bacterium]